MCISFVFCWLFAIRRVCRLCLCVSFIVLFVVFAVSRVLCVVVVVCACVVGHVCFICVLCSVCVCISVWCAMCVAIVLLVRCVFRCSWVPVSLMVCGCVGELLTGVYVLYGARCLYVVCCFCVSWVVCFVLCVSGGMCDVFPGGRCSWSCLVWCSFRGLASYVGCV